MQRQPSDASTLTDALDEGAGAAQTQRWVQDGTDGRAAHRVPQRAAPGTHVGPDGAVGCSRLGGRRIR